MYLVHISLESPSHGDSLPPDAHHMIASSAVASDGIEHVAVHACARPHPVIGVLLRAPSLATAEATVERIWREAARSHKTLSSWVLKRVEVALPPAGLD
ncbi:hypothetical protein [Streptomyces sp. NPDC048057]|uniref:hypothetical protein n=1 Tax=Streptomyces sp. NPDC048057 TaxID=3155628 RepID=UPI0033E55ACE